MQNYFATHPKTRNTILSAMAALIVIVIIAISIVQYNRNPYGPATSINNLTNVVNNLSRDQIFNITNQLYTIISNNSPEDKAIPTSGAIARPNNVIMNYDEATDIYYDSFIVDIESVQQSYLAQLEWSDDADNPNLSGYSVLITCLTDPALIIYPNFDCKDSINLSTSATDGAYASLWDYLPYTGTTANGDSYTVSLSYTASDAQQLQVSISNCGNQSIKDAALIAAKNWLKSLNFDPELFTFDVPSIYNNCIIR